MLTAPTVIDTRDFRHVMGHLPTAVVAITGIQADTGQPAGLIVGTFQSLSLEPPLVSFSVGRGSTSWPKIQPWGRFSASVLAAGQEHVCRALSAKHDDKFSAVDWVYTDHATPHISNAHAWIDCELLHELDGGDHVIVIGRVVALIPGDGAPLVFHRGRLSGLDVPSAPLMSA